MAITMKNTHKLLQHYLGQETRRLKCSKKSRACFYQGVRHNIEEFLQNNPEASQEELYSFLGDPKQLVCNFLEQLSYDEVQRAQRRSKWRVAVVILLAAVLLTVILFLLWYSRFGHMTFVENPTIVYY